METRSLLIEQASSQISPGTLPPPRPTRALRLLVSVGDPAPLIAPIAAHGPLQAFGIDEAWALSGGRERWTLAVGNWLGATVWTRARSRTNGAAMVASAVGR